MRTRFLLPSVVASAAVFAALAPAAACSSSSGSSDGAGSADGGPGGGGDGQAASGDGGGDDDGGGAEGSTKPYAGGDVTVSVAAVDGGAVDTNALAGKVTIHVVPANPSALSKIDALVDGKTVGTVSAGPFDVAWDSATVANGAHAIAARAYDLASATMTTKDLPVTTNNFLLAGTWMMTNVHDAKVGSYDNPCSSTSFTVTFDAQTSTMTVPTFYLTCMANTSYSAKITGFTKTVAAAEYSGPITYTQGTITTQMSTTKFEQDDSFQSLVRKGDIARP